MEEDASHQDDERGAERMCLVTRSRHEPEAMIRFVVGLDGEIIPDIAHKLPGRGVWILARAPYIEQAVRRNLLPKGLKLKDKPHKGPIDVPIRVRSDLADWTGNLLRAHTRQALSLANKAGAIVTGFGKVEEQLARNKVAGLIFARDGSVDGLRKMRQIANRIEHSEEAQKVRPVEFSNIFDSVDLDLAFGRTNVIHAAVLDNAAGRMALSRLQKYASYGQILSQEELMPPSKGVVKERLSGTGANSQGRMTNE